MRDDYVPKPGPAAYPIKPDCPAPRHNTLNAARGIKSYSSKFRHRQVTGFTKCVCDRAVELNEAFQAKRRAQHIARKGMVSAPERTLAESERNRRAALLDRLAAVPRPAVPAPDFTDAACRTPHGVMTMDDYIDSPRTPTMTERARRLCNDKCPIRDACGTWVTASERPAGSWGGMYAGMTPQNRRDLAIATHEKQQAEQALFNPL